MSEEWAIQSSSDGAWLAATGITSSRDWSADASRALRWDDYTAAARNLVFIKDDGCCSVPARIVPAPPREMTDEECMTWLLNETGLFMKGYAEKCFAGWGVYQLDTRECLGSSNMSHFDAIRAARRKLEKKP